MPRHHHRCEILNVGTALVAPSGRILAVFLIRLHVIIDLAFTCFLIKIRAAKSSRVDPSPKANSILLDTQLSRRSSHNVFVSKATMDYLITDFGKCVLWSCACALIFLGIDRIVSKSLNLHIPRIGKASNGFFGLARARADFLINGRRLAEEGYSKVRSVVTAYTCKESDRGFSTKTQSMLSRLQIWSVLFFLASTRTSLEPIHGMSLVVSTRNARDTLPHGTHWMLLREAAYMSMSLEYS